MGCYYDAAMAIYIHDLSEIIKKYEKSETFLSAFDADKSYIYQDCVIFKWNNLKDYLFSNEYNLLRNIAKEIDVDYIVVAEDCIEYEEYQIGVLYHQSPTPLAPDDLYLEQAWRAIESLRTYLKEKYGESDESIYNIISKNL